jgi:hypothetical protein
VQVRGAEVPLDAAEHARVLSAVVEPAAVAEGPLDVVQRQEVARQDVPGADEIRR